MFKLLLISKYHNINSLMALPTNLAAKIKAVPMDPSILATDLQLAYLLSFSQQNITHDSIYTSPRQSYVSPLQHYQFADFQDATYDKLLEETHKNLKLKNKQVVKGIRCGFKEFYARVATNTYNTTLKFLNREKTQSDRKFALAKEDEEFRIEGLRGNNPAKWPESIKDFVKQVSHLPWSAFANDSQLMFNDFVQSAKNAILTLCKKPKLTADRLQSAFKQNLTLQIQGLLGVTLRTNNQSYILEQLKFVSELSRVLELSSEDEAEICSHIAALFDRFFSLVPREGEAKYHYPDHFSSRDPFVIMKKLHFQKYSGLAYYSIATDGKYLYFYVSAINGGMFKIGTGQAGTKAGQIYLEKKIHFPIGTKVDEVSWVFLKGKLYLKTSSKDPWVVQVRSPDTFEKEGYIQLFCPALFGHQSLINLNKNSPLLTDGNSLFYLGVRIKIAKGEQSEVKPQSKKQKSPEKVPEDKKEQTVQQKKKPKKFKKNEAQQPPTEEQKNQNYHKILQIVLYEFSLQPNRTYSYEDVDQKDIEQLYDSFSGYFSRPQCRRALVLNNYDLAETCQWLFNEGQKEKEKNIKIYEEVDYVILAQAEITSNFQQKNIKAASEIVTREGSTLSISNINESLWTIDRDQISCYSEHGIKVFSKRKQHSHISPDTKLSTTLLKTLQPKFPKNPQYNILFDPYNSLFFTFCWPQDGHYFPAVVLVSGDKKSSAAALEQKRLSASSLKLGALSDVPKLALKHISLLDKSAIRAKYRFNDWLWFYAQKIIEIGNELNLPESDKKRLSNKRTKVLAKINKINETDKVYEKDKAEFNKKNKVIKSVIKIYPFDAEGTPRNYAFITEAFKSVLKHPEQINLFVVCLENWLLSCPSSPDEQVKKTLVEMGDTLLALKEASPPCTRTYINKLLFSEFYLFFPSLQRQVKLITSLTEPELKQFLESRSVVDKTEKEEIIYEVTKKQHLTQKYELNKCEFAEIFKAKSNVSLSDNSHIEHIGNILFSDLLKTDKEHLIVKEKIEEPLRKALLDYAFKNALQHQTGSRFIEFLLLDALKLLTDNSKDCHTFMQYQCQLFVQILKLYERILSKSKPDQIYDILPSILMVIQIYHASLVPLHPQQDIVCCLFRVIEHLLKPEFNEFLSHLQDVEFEGISATSEKIYETSHPLQRGKNYNFPSRTYPNASVLLLDLDKRCQSDPNNDTLNIQLLHEDAPVGNNILVNDGVFNSFLRLSGVVDTKKPYLLLGNSVNVDFASSGQVKDSQSLVRYGFKFGMRPVFVGRHLFDQQKKAKVHKIFRTVSNCQNYINTLKFAVVAASNTIESYLYLENEHSDAKIDDLLKGKVFKEGFEESSYKFDSSTVGSYAAIDRFISKGEHEFNDRSIVKRTHQKNWVVSETQSVKIEQSQQLWNFENIPTYIKGYLEQIKQFKGDFIEVFTEARQLAKEKGAYAHILRKKIFQDNHRQFWLQGEAILFLTILKHSGLLHLNLKFSIQYIKENLKAFQDARDGIYYSFISRIQNVNEWRDLLQTYTGKSALEELEKKEEVEEKKVTNFKEISLKKRGVVIKTVKLGTEREKTLPKKEKIQQKPPQHMSRAAFDKLVRERLSNNESLIKGICSLKSIRYEEANPYDTVTNLIDQIIKASEQPLESADNAYIEPIEHLIRSCLFLLKFKSPSTKQSLQSNEAIVPINLSRSLSSDHRNVDANKLKLFREWLQNWKKWKGFKKEGKIELKFPVEEIVKYINSWIHFRDIEAAITLRHHRTQNRILFYSHNAQLIKLLSNTPLVKYTLASETLNLPHAYNSDLSSIGTLKLQELDQVYAEFKNVIKTVENSLIERLPLSFSKFDQAIKDPKQHFLQRMKLVAHTLALLQSENPEINLNVVLYFLSFKYLSNHHEDLIYLSHALLQRAFICEHSNTQLLSLLSKEVGNNNIASKRWKDYFFVERVLFLLRKLEVNVRRKLPFEDKLQIAETVFYILYHIETPLVARLALKIIKKLNIPLKQGIRTPLEREYKLYAADAKQELLLKQTFRLPNSRRNNVELLCTKINSIFAESSPNELTLKFNEAKQRSDEEPRYNIILNLHQEQDLYWMIKVLYYIDELQLKSGEKTLPEIKDWEEYLQLKGRKKEDRKTNEQQNNNQNGASEPDKDKIKDQEKTERIFTVLPRYSRLDTDLQQELPVGWYFNYCNVFADPLQKTANPKPPKAVSPNANKNQRGNKNNPNNPNNNNNNPNKKNWNTPVYTKLLKKYEELNSKPVEQPKETDSDQLKSEYVKFKNYFGRIRRYFMQINTLIDHFCRTGYYIFKEDVSRTKMNQICQLITLGSANRLKDIPIVLNNNDVKNRLLVNDFLPNFSTKLKITLIKTKHFSHFDNLLTSQNTLSSSKQELQSSYYTLLGKRELSLPDSKAYMPYEQFVPYDDPTEEQDIEFGKQWIENSFSRMKKKYEKVYLYDYPNNTFYLGQGGIESGVKDNILVPADDHTLTLQTSSYDKIHTHPKHAFDKEYEQTELPEELIEKIQTILEKKTISISTKADIKDYLLLTFYLKKLNNFDLHCIPKDLSKEFASRLFKFSSALNSYKQLSLYQEDVQKLILKLIDNEHEELHLFGNYIFDEDYHHDLQSYLIPLKLQKLNSSNEVKQESSQTHSYTKSKYLLKSQPPQIEQNKLLKYWQKSILPKIYEFVKTTLKPIEIEDFWEQMRRPLRVNDHTEAKRVAYIICDNKLPNGAVIPDASHNWNSLEVEEIFVGENVLVKLPKNRSEFCTPLLGWGSQDSRLGKVIFIDTKNNSVLLRYRIEELALFSYTWVPVNALMAVEKEVMHISTKSIYEQLQKKLQGIIYIHAKQCLTKLAGSVSEVDNIKLIKETILDLFINNPISGCFDFPKPNWSMRPIFEKMLQDNNFTILDMLQHQFANIKGIDLNLNSETITTLNRFEGAKALILSFKRQAKLSQCSGIRFFSDKYGYNEVAHVYTAKSERTDIEPIEFNQPNIYCSFYTNKECLPIVQQNNYKIHPIEATIFAVDDMWTIGCYLGQILCEIATAKPTAVYLQVLQRINKIFITWILKKSVSVLCSYLSKLISKICLTISYICEKSNIEPTLESMGITNDQLKNLIAWINKLANEENKEVVALYTALLQNLSEMAASILLKLPAGLGAPPEHVKAAMDLIRMFKEIDNFTKTKKISLEVGALPSYQWERILHISSIPPYFNEQTVLSKIKEIVQLNKAKILSPAHDIFLKNGNCFILVDGWDINELIEEEVIEKMQQEEEEEKQEEQNQTGMMTWICPACTYQNPLNLNLCDMCQSPAPVAAKPEEVYDVVEATDLKAAELRLRQREAKRFEEVKVQILKFFEDEHKVICELVEKKNKEAEQGKNKDPKKNKKADGKQELREAPQKPAIQLQTGSAVFKNELIQEFLRVRYEAITPELKKQVEEQATYLAKFQKLLNLGFDLWGDNIYSENATLIPFNHLYLLMDYIQSEICKGSSSVLSYSQQSIRILSKIPLLDSNPNEQPINYTSQNDIGVRVKYKPLADFKSYNIRYSWKLVKELNLAASKCLQFINMDVKYDKERNDTCPIFNDSLGYKLKYFRNLIMGVIKLELFQKIMQKTSVLRQNDEIPKIYLERLKTRQERSREGLVTVKQKEDHLFTKAHDQFLKISPAFLRPFKPKGTDPYLSFTVTFKGENVQGEAGPYRQFFTDISRELDPTYNLGLFIPSPNNRHQWGDHKSKWVINPKANSTYHFSLFEFVGILMGCCVRTGGHLALDLPNMFWKCITHEEITEQDLQEVDSQLISMIRMLKDCPSEEALNEAMDATNGGPLTWTFRTCDDELHEMIPNGKNIVVEFSGLSNYIQQLKLKKINQTKLQIKRILQGLSQLIPLPYLHCLTGEELKLVICGRPKVDVDLLKRHTKYSGGLNEQSRRIKFFWQIMRQLVQVDRLKIIRFCWGQQRLPINSEQFERNNIRFMIKPMLANIKNQDQALPKADTCFFNIELPDYSTKHIMKEKILLAVNLDNVSINADENINNEDNPLMNEIDSYEQDDDYDEENNVFGGGGG